MTNTVLVKHGYQKLADGSVEPKPYRPKTIGDAREIVRQVFERNKWDDDDRRRYFKMKSIDAERLDDLSGDELRVVIGDMEKAKMVLFNE